METPRRATLSVAIITLNEEANLPRTLASVVWADEIVIVDSGSTDGTRAIAQSYGARFITEPWRGFAAQKNFAMSLCTSDWVLSLDADEAATPELAASLQKIITTEPLRIAYALRRRNFFLGRWIRHGGYYPECQLPLFRAARAPSRDCRCTKQRRLPAVSRRSMAICCTMRTPRSPIIWTICSATAR